jgi:hypothetical protein
MNPKIAIVFLPGFYGELHNFFLDYLQNREYGFRSYQEIHGQDSSIIRQIILDKSILDIYEFDYPKNLSSSEPFEWINLLASIRYFLYWLVPGREWIKIRLRNEKRNKPIGYWNSLRGYPLVLTASYVIFYFISAFYLLIILGNFLNNSSIPFSEFISNDIAVIVNGTVNFLCMGGSEEKIRTCTHVLAWVSIMIWILSVWFFSRIRIGLRLVAFIQGYLDNELLRVRTRSEILKILNSVTTKDYSEILIVAHSFGVLAGADAIGHLITSSHKSLKFVSLGNSLAFLSIKRYGLISDIVTQCAKNLIKINGFQCKCWIDYRANIDSLSTPIDKTLFKEANLWSSVGIEEKVIHQNLDFSGFWDSINDHFSILSGKYHLVYFQKGSCIARAKNIEADNKISVIESMLKDQLHL